MKGMTESPHSSWAHVYDFVLEHTFGGSYAAFTQNTLDLIREKFPPPAKVVDFGAGTGRLSVPLAGYGYDVTAVEPCLEMLEQLKSKSSAPNLAFQQSRMQDFAGTADHDLALCVFTVVAYICDRDELEAALLAAFRSLKPGGRLLIDIPSRGLFSNYARSDERFERRATVAETGENVFLYHDRIVLKEPGGDLVHTDEFHIRYWPQEEIIQAAENAGFHLVEDCSAHFFRSGAYYLLMGKQ